MHRRGLLRNTALSNAYIIFIIQKVFYIRKILFLTPFYKNETLFRLHYVIALELACEPTKNREARSKRRGFIRRRVLRYVNTKVAKQAFGGSFCVAKDPERKRVGETSTTVRASSTAMKPSFSREPRLRI